MDSPRILVADDSPLVLRMIEKMMTEAGLQVVTARDGLEALDKAVNQDVQLVILDVMMPRMNGYQACRLLKTEPTTASVPVVILTSRDQEGDRFWGLETGADYYITKDSEPHRILDLVKNILAMTLMYGYDGVDLDWEVAEDPNYDNNPANVARFLAFHKEVRDSVRTHKGLMITAAITDDWYPNCSAAVCPIMDQANSMSYDQTAASEWRDASIVFKLGAPKANHGIGFDMSNLADNLAKCRLAIDSGFGGVMGWDVGKSSATAYDSLARYVTHTPVTGVYPFRIRSPRTARPTLFAGAGSLWFNGGAYDARGRRTATVLLGGPASAP